MTEPQTGNDLETAVPKFCLALEQYRRTPDGRIRTSQDFLNHFCPYDQQSCSDRVFRFIPTATRGPILAAWGIRGLKAALRDPDDRVQTILHESLVAGDIDHAAFEDGLAPETIVRWVPLGDFWSFWRAGKLTKNALRKAFETAYELQLFDARWFLDTVEVPGGRLRGTDVLAEGLSKADLTAWVRRIHESRDGSPKGILTALGWESIVAKTADPVLIAALDAIANKIGLKAGAASEDRRAGGASADAAPAGRTNAPGPNQAIVPPPPATSASAEPSLGVEPDGSLVIETAPGDHPPQLGDVIINDDFLTDEDLEPSTSVSSMPTNLDLSAGEGANNRGRDAGKQPSDGGGGGGGGRGRMRPR